MQKTIKSLIILLVLVVLKLLTPDSPLDQWNLLNPNKIVTMILALALIQALSSAFAQYLGTRTGAILTGFFGGIISSTATTASTAKNSNYDQTENNAVEVMTIISAIAAMLFEGIVLVSTGMNEVHYKLLIIFIAPLMTSFLLIYLQYTKISDQKENEQNTDFKILPIIKLTIFIIAILAISKIFQSYFGQNGLFVVTSLVSLFEVHGSLIANIQLHEMNAINTIQLSNLLTLSILASFISKIFLIWTLGSSNLRVKATRYIMLLLASVFFSWGIQILILLK